MFRHFSSDEAFEFIDVLWSVHGGETNLDKVQFYNCAKTLLSYIERPGQGREASIGKCASFGMPENVASEVLETISNRAYQEARKSRKWGIVGTVGGLIILGLVPFTVVESKPKLFWAIAVTVCVIFAARDLIRGLICLKKLRRTI